MNKTTALLLSSSLLALAQPPPGVQLPVAEECGPRTVCVNKYAAVLPYHFFRNTSSNENKYDFRDTSVPSNGTGFSLIQDADFVVFDKELAMQYLGPNPTYEFVFAVSPAVHEAPVYAPEQNLLFMSQLAPPTGVLPQLVVDLNVEPPTIADYLPDPPIYAPNGGTFRDGLIVFGASGGNDSLGGTEQRVSIQTVDPATNKSTVLLNNYYGYYFNNIDDLAMHPTTREIFFTDPYYSYFNGLTDTAPQLPAATYRFNPKTGAVVLIDDTLAAPNGLDFSPDGTTLYISDTGGVGGTYGPGYLGAGTQFNTTGPRTIYAFDVDASGTKVNNKRSFYLSQDWVPDGVKVAANGVVLTGSGSGVDVIAPTGELILRIQTNYTVQNFAWTGKELSTLWIMGNDGVSRVEWGLVGKKLV